MHEAPVMPDDLESCQRLLQEAWAIQAELTSTCMTLQESREQLWRENEELQLTIKNLLHQTYGRRSERLLEGRGQQQLDFGDGDTACDPSILSAAPDEPITQEIVANSAELFGPLADLCRQRVLASEIIGTDDTPVTLLTPGEEAGSRKARFWLYRGRVAAPYDVFAFTDSRARDGPHKFLEPSTVRHRGPRAHAGRRASFGNA